MAMSDGRTLLLFFFNDTATTEIYTLSLHDALPIYLLRAALLPRPRQGRREGLRAAGAGDERGPQGGRRPLRPAQQGAPGDRKSTRLNSSHANISYAVFCLKKKISDTLPDPCSCPPT